MFRRVALTGSAELFRNTTEGPAPAPPDPHLEQAPEPGQLPPVETYYQYSLTEAQVQTLVEALQKIKYPHNLKSASRLNMEDFERLEALRQILLAGLR